MKPTSVKYFPRGRILQIDISEVLLGSGGKAIRAFEDGLLEVEVKINRPKKGKRKV